MMSHMCLSGCLTCVYQDVSCIYQDISGHVRTRGRRRVVVWLVGSAKGVGSGLTGAEERADASP